MNLIYRSAENPNSHHTAIPRTDASFPARHLVHRHLVKGRVLDFGCGQGADVRYLKEAGIDVTGFDPYYAPAPPVGRFDTILCTYVLNVLLPLEQTHVLMAVSELLSPQGFAYFTVRRDIERNGFRHHAVHHTQVYQCTVRLPYPSILQAHHCEIYIYQPLQSRAGDDRGCEYCCPGAAFALITESAMAYAVRRTGPAGESILVVPKLHRANLSDLPSRVHVALDVVSARTKLLLESQYPSLRWRVIPCEAPACHAHLCLVPD